MLAGTSLNLIVPLSSFEYKIRELCIGGIIVSAREDYIGCGCKYLLKRKLPFVNNYKNLCLRLPSKINGIEIPHISLLLRSP